MFGIKQDKAKELETQLQEAKAKAEKSQGQLEMLRRISQDTESHFEAQIAAQSEMDKELTKVVSYAHETMEASHAGKEKLEKFSGELKGIEKHLETVEEKHHDLREAMEKQTSELISMVEENKYYTTPIKFLQQGETDMEQNFQKASDQLKQMRDFSKQMSVLALNCAIEAGRMGPGARPFIGAAEDVRQLAGEYEQAASDLQAQIRDMQKWLVKFHEQVSGLTSYLKENSTSMNKLAEHFSENAQLCREITADSYSERLGKCKARLKELSDGQDTITSLQEQTLSEMENVGESFMDEQNARKAVEAIFDQVKDAFRRQEAE